MPLLTRSVLTRILFLPLPWEWLFADDGVDVGDVGHDVEKFAANLAAGGEKYAALGVLHHLDAYLRFRHGGVCDPPVQRYASAGEEEEVRVDPFDQLHGVGACQTIGVVDHFPAC